MKKNLFVKTMIVLGAAVSLVFGIAACGKKGPVTIKEISASDTSNPTFELGAEVSLANRLLNVTLSNGQTRVIEITDEMWSVAADYFNTVGTHDVTVTFEVNGKEETFTFHIEITEPYDVTEFKGNVDSYYGQDRYGSYMDTVQELMDAYNGFSAVKKTLLEETYYDKLVPLYKETKLATVEDETVNGIYAPEFYDAAGKTQIESIITAAKTGLNNVTLEGLTNFINNVKAQLSAVPSAKDNAKAGLDALLTRLVESNYTAANWATIGNKINAAKASIDAATGSSQVSQIVETVNREVMAVDTIASSAVEATIASLVTVDTLTAENANEYTTVINEANAEYNALNSADKARVDNYSTLERVTLVRQKIAEIAGCAVESDYDAADWTAIVASRANYVAQIKSANSEDAMDVVISTFASTTLSQYMSNTVRDLNTRLEALPVNANLADIEEQKAELDELMDIYDGLVSGQKQLVSTEGQNKFETLQPKVDGLYKLVTSYNPDHYDSTGISAINDILDEAETSINNASLSAIESIVDNYISAITYGVNNKWTNAKSTAIEELRAYVENNDTYAYINYRFTLNGHRYNANSEELDATLNNAIRDIYDLTEDDDFAAFESTIATKVANWKEELDDLFTVTIEEIGNDAIAYLDSKVDINRYSNTIDRAIVASTLQDIREEIASHLGNGEFSSIQDSIDNAIREDIEDIDWSFDVTITKADLYDKLTDLNVDTNRYVRVGEVRPDIIGLESILFGNSSYDDLTTLSINGNAPISMPCIRVVSEGNKSYIELSVLALMYIREWQNSEHNYSYLGGWSLKDGVPCFTFYTSPSYYYRHDTYTITFPWSIEDDTLGEFNTPTTASATFNRSANDVNTYVTKDVYNGAISVTATVSDRHYSVTYNHLQADASLGVRIIRVAQNDYEAKYFVFTDGSDTSLTVYPDKLVDTAVRSDTGTAYYTVDVLGIRTENGEYYGYASANNSINVSHIADDTAAKAQAIADLEAYVSSLLSQYNYTSENIALINQYKADAIAEINAVGTLDGHSYYLISSVPADWAANCSSYYTTLGGVNYERVHAVAPTWMPDTYYRYENGDYVLLTYEDLNWEYDYDTFYVYDGTYTNVSGVAPEFKANRYYEYNTSTTEYDLLNSKPANWETNYNDYYYVSYNLVNRVAPEFVANQYYEKVEDDYLPLGARPVNWDGEFYTFYMIGYLAITDDEAPVFEQDKYYAVENGVYTLLTEEPEYWEYDYNDSNKYRVMSYVAVASVAPEFEEGYYYRSEADYKAFALHQFNHYYDEAINNINSVSTYVALDQEDMAQALKDFADNIPEDAEDVNNYYNDTSSPLWIDLGIFKGGYYGTTTVYVDTGSTYEPFDLTTINALSINDNILNKVNSFADMSDLFRSDAGHLYMNALLYLQLADKSFKVVTEGTEFTLEIDPTDIVDVTVSNATAIPYQGITGLDAYIGKSGDSYSIRTDHYGNTFNLTLGNTTGFGNYEHLYAYSVIYTNVYNQIGYGSGTAPTFTQGRYYDYVSYENGEYVDRYVLLSVEPNDWEYNYSNYYVIETQANVYYQKVSSSNIYTLLGRLYDRANSTGVSLSEGVTNEYAASINGRIVFVNSNGTAVGIYEFDAQYHFVECQGYEEIRIKTMPENVYKLGENMDTTFAGLVIEGKDAETGLYRVVNPNEYTIQYDQREYESLRDGNNPGVLTVTITTKIGNQSTWMYVHYIPTFRVTVEGVEVDGHMESDYWSSSITYNYQLDDQDEWPLTISITNLPNGYTVYDENDVLIDNPSSIKVRKQDVIWDDFELKIEGPNYYSKSISFNFFKVTLIDSITLAGVNAVREESSTWTVTLEEASATYPLVIDIPVGYTFTVKDEDDNEINDLTDITFNLMDPKKYVITIRDNQNKVVETNELEIELSENYLTVANNAVGVGNAYVDVGIFSGSLTQIITPLLTGNDLGVFFDGGLTITISVLDDEGNEIYDSVNEKVTLTKKFNDLKVLLTIDGNKYYAEFTLVNIPMGELSNAYPSFDLEFYYNDSIKLDGGYVRSTSFYDGENHYLHWTYIEAPIGYDLAHLSVSIEDSWSANGINLSNQTLYDNDKVIRYEEYDDENNFLGYLYVKVGTSRNAIDDNAGAFLLVVNNTEEIAELFAGGMSMEDILTTFGIQFSETTIGADNELYDAGIAHYYRATIDNVSPSTVLLGSPENEFATADTAKFEHISGTFDSGLSFGISMPDEFTEYFDIISADGTRTNRYILDCTKAPVLFAVEVTYGNSLTRRWEQMENYSEFDENEAGYVGIISTTAVGQGDRVSIKFEAAADVLEDHAIWKVKNDATSAVDPNSFDNVVFEAQEMIVGVETHYYVEFYVYKLDKDGNPEGEPMRYVIVFNTSQN